MKGEQRRLSFEVGVNDDYVSILVQTTLQLFNPSNELIQQQSFISKKGISNKLEPNNKYCKQVDCLKFDCRSPSGWDVLQ